MRKYRKLSLDKVPKDFKGRCEYWRKVGRAYGNMEKKLDCSDYHWRIITYKDGYKQLSYLRVREKGFWSAGSPPYIICGILFTRRLSTREFANIKDIRLAF